MGKEYMVQSTQYIKKHPTNRGFWHPALFLAFVFGLRTQM